MRQIVLEFIERVQKSTGHKLVAKLAFIELPPQDRLIECLQLSRVNFSAEFKPNRQIGDFYCESGIDQVNNFQLDRAARLIGSLKRHHGLAQFV